MPDDLLVTPAEEEFGRRIPEQDVALGIELTTGLAQWVDNLQIRHLPDSGHWVQQEQPEKVNSLMLEFLQGSQYASS